MKYLTENKNWNIVEDCNLEKLLYLLIDRPDYTNIAHLFIWLNDKDQYHRNYDLPAIEWPNGTKSWFLNGKCHRENNVYYTLK